MAQQQFEMRSPHKLNCKTAHTLLGFTVTGEITVADRLLYRMPELTRAVGLSKATIYRLIKAGRFPKPVWITDDRVGWKVNDVKIWVAERPQTQ